MEKRVEFERCADFLARMIEKYGNDVCLPNTTQTNNVCEDDSNDSDSDRIFVPTDECYSA